MAAFIRSLASRYFPNPMAAAASRRSISSRRNRETLPRPVLILSRQAFASPISFSSIRHFPRAIPDSMSYVLWSAIIFLASDALPSMVLSWLSSLHPRLLSTS
jgi:hypothetical protein